MRFEDVVFVYHLRDEGQMAWHGRRHAHGAGLFELHYFIGGDGSFRNGRSVRAIRTGDLHLTPPGVEHQILATDVENPITYYAVLFDAAGDDELGDLLAEGSALGRGPWSIGTAHRFFFATLLERRASPKREVALAARHGFLAFLYGLASGDPRDYGRADNVHVEKALAIMQGSIDRALDLNALCARISLSTEHFVRLFVSRMGMPPMRYYTRLKIEAARAMLSSSSLRVGEIADRLGYENQFGFTRAFKRVSGVSPTEYRERYLQKADFAASLSREPKRQPQ